MKWLLMVLLLAGCASKERETSEGGSLSWCVGVCGEAGAYRDAHTVGSEVLQDESIVNEPENEEK